MSPDTLSSIPASSVREVQVDAQSRKKPKVVERLAEWEYLERSFHRMLAGWGRSFSEWEDKVSACQHVWETSECVRRVRDRLTEFPGTKSNLDLPVSSKLEKLVNTVLEAPSLEDAIDGIYQFFSGSLARSYIHYLEVAHPVHDAPTLSLVAANVRVKEQFRLWFQARRRQIPHAIQAEYAEKLQRALVDCDELRAPLAVDEAAHPMGVRSPYRPIAVPPHPANTEGGMELMDYLAADFVNSLEARRLFWCYGYMREMNLAEEQLLWIYDAWHMPWEFLQDLSRHTWDESRHGDSGRSRLLDFGIDITEIGYVHYNVPPASPDGLSLPMSPQSLYDSVLFIGMVAETGHFTVKHEAYADLREGGDLESAEMVLFDIIDETTHVQYAHRWLPVMADRLGIPSEDFKSVGLAKRQECESNSLRDLEALVNLPREGEAYEKYQSYLRRMREAKPLTNATSCPPRSMKPM